MKKIKYLFPFMFLPCLLFIFSCQAGKRSVEEGNNKVTSFHFNEPDSTWNTFKYDRSVRCEWESSSGRNGTGSIVISGNTLHAKWERNFEVKANHSYKITAYVKGEGKTRAHLSVDDRYSSKAVHGSFNWTLLSMEYTPEKEGMVTVNCNFGYRSGQTIYHGTVWFDDLKITRLK